MYGIVNEKGLKLRLVMQQAPLWSFKVTPVVTFSKHCTDWFTWISYTKQVSIIYFLLVHWKMRITAYRITFKKWSLINKSESAPHVYSEGYDGILEHDAHQQHPV